MKTPACLLAAFLLVTLHSEVAARIILMTDRNDTYMFEDAQAVFGGALPPLGLTSQLLVCSELKARQVYPTLIDASRGLGPFGESVGCHCIIQWGIKGGNV